MPWFPIIAEERESAERALGVRLPTRYCELLSDTRVQELLSHQAMGMLAPGQRMAQFVELTQKVRRTEPGFPADGVVATAPQGRYFRFWLPDPRHPRVLGEMRHTWDTVTHRARKDCTNAESVSIALQALYGTAPEAFDAAGYPAPDMGATDGPRVSIRACDPATAALLATSALVQAADSWHRIGVLHVQGRYLTLCDAGEVPEGTAQFALKVPPGRYDVAVQLRVSRNAGGVVVAGVRVLREGATAADSQHVAEIDIDRASLAIHDRQAFFAQVTPGDREAAVEVMLDAATLPCIAVLGRSAECVLVPTGDGDGRYPVHRLAQGAETVGLECGFVDI